MIQKDKVKYIISFSEFSTFIQCPHKWYLSYCLRLPQGPSEELIFGQAVHKTLEEIFLKPFFQREMYWGNLFKENLKKELQNIDDKQFLAKFMDQHLPQIYTKKGVELIKELNFFKRYKDYKIVHIEYKLDDFLILETEDAEFRFKGYIDLVLKHKKTGQYLLLDWKTSGKEWDIKQKIKDNDDFFAQLALYKLFFSKKEGIPLSQIDCKFYNLPRKNPKLQQEFSGNIPFSYLKHLFFKVQNSCDQILNINPMHLQKIKFRTKKNYCSRCSYNTERLCNDSDEFQSVN